MTYLHDLKWANSYERLPILMAQKRHDENWFEALGNEWSATDNQWRFADQLKHIFRKSTRQLLDKMMTSNEHEALAMLPDVVLVFRGQDHTLPFGLSWSLEQKIAEQFPFNSRYRCTNPVLLIAAIPKQSIVALKLDRDESEAIILPPTEAWVQKLEAKQ